MKKTLQIFGNYHHRIHRFEHKIRENPGGTGTEINSRHAHQRSAHVTLRDRSVITHSAHWSFSLFISQSEHLRIGVRDNDKRCS